MEDDYLWPAKMSDSPPGTAFLFFLSPLHVFMCFSHWPVLVTTLCVFACYSLSVVCLFLESSHVSQQMAHGWYCHSAQEAVWLQTWSMSLELICILSFKRLLMQSGLKRNRVQCRVNQMTLCKHFQTHLAG